MASIVRLAVKVVRFVQMKVAVFPALLFTPFPTVFAINKLAI
jgi:hypothetical protein